MGLGALLDKPKGFVNSHLPPSIREPIPVMIISIVLFVAFVVYSPFWGGCWFCWIEHMDVCWFFLPLGIAYYVVWVTALWIMIVCICEVVCSNLANQLMCCCGKEAQGLTCFMGGLAFLLVWLVAWVISLIADNGCKVRLWTRFSWYVLIFLGMPAGFVFYVCVYPNGGSRSVGGGGGDAGGDHYQAMPKESNRM